MVVGLSGWIWTSGTLLELAVLVGLPPELILGILLTLGLFTRISAFLGAGMMAYAYLFTHLPEGVTPVEKHGGAYAVVYCTTFLLLYIQPSTRLSLDYLLKQRMTPAA